MRCIGRSHDLMRKIILPVAFFGLIVFSISGCSDETDAEFQAGYGDGNAVGYNTACKLEYVHMIHADWSSPAYSEGYATGVREGIIECHEESAQKTGR